MYEANRDIVDKLNRPMHDLRISLTDRCNFNCNYCMPHKDIEFLPKEELLSFEEIEHFVKIMSSLGIKKIKLTGGEPTLRIGLDVLIKKLSAIDGIDDIGLISNGVFIKTIGHRLKKAGLNRISISLDALDNRVFQSIVGSSNAVHPVLEGIEVAKNLGFSPIKINCVIQRNINEDQILPLAEYFRKENFHLRFIEFMDVGDITWKEEDVFTSKEIFDLISSKYPLKPKDASYYGEVATRFVYEDGKGEVGFISSVSNPFCRDCTRLRISSDGKLFACLFTDKFLDLRSMLRASSSDEEIANAIEGFWRMRDDRYSEERKEDINRPRRDMNFMGG